MQSFNYLRLRALQLVLSLTCASCVTLVCVPCTRAVSLNVENRAYKSEGHSIRTEWYYAPEGDVKQHPTLIVLHGSGGLDETGGFFREMAGAIAKTGTTCVIVHYMDRSNLQSASNAQMSTNFRTWVRTIHDAVTFVKAQPDIAPERISIFGHSLGAQLALHEAANDPRIHSIIDMAGCFVLGTSSIKHMPEILIWHGTADRVVPISREKSLVQVLVRTHSKYSEELFPGADHTFQKVSMDRLLKSAVLFLKH